MINYIIKFNIMVIILLDDYCPEIRSGQKTNELDQVTKSEPKNSFNSQKGYYHVPVLRYNYHLENIRIVSHTFLSL